MLHVYGNILFGSDATYYFPLQFSSLGSLDEKWMNELAYSMSSGLSDEKSPLGLGKAMIVWPTVEDVRCSLEVISIRTKYKSNLALLLSLCHDRLLSLLILLLLWLSLLVVALLLIEGWIRSVIVIAYDA